MAAPWYIYLIALLLALPVFALLAVFGYTLLRAVVAWVTEPDAPQPQK
jgi:hypothetical protein